MKRRNASVDYINSLSWSRWWQVRCFWQVYKLGKKVTSLVWLILDWNLRSYLKGWNNGRVTAKRSLFRQHFPPLNTRKWVGLIYNDSVPDLCVALEQTMNLIQDDPTKFLQPDRLVHKTPSVSCCGSFEQSCFSIHRHVTPACFKTAVYHSSCNLAYLQRCSKQFRNNVLFV